MRSAARDHHSVNLIDMRTQAKVDLSVLPDTAYFERVLDRRRRMDYRPGGPAFWTVTAEDIVLMKLLWRKDTLSQKQWDNALSVVQVQGARLDWKYLRLWAGKLNLMAELERLCGEAGI